MKLTKKEKELVKETKHKLKEAQKNWDIENAHYDGDNALCELLKGLGLEDVVIEFKDIEKWEKRKKIYENKAKIIGRLEE